MIKQLFQSSPTVASAAFIVGAFSLLSRVAGLFRDRVLISLFNEGTLDIYYQSFRLPDFFFQLFVVGAISASFIPVFTRAWKDDDKERAWRYTNNILHVVLLFFGLVSVFVVIFAPRLAPLIAPGFSPEAQAQVAEITRIIFLGQFFFALSMVFGSVLQGAKRFLLPSVAPIVYNAGIILGALFFSPVFGDLQGLAWGVVLGAFLHALVQIVGAISLGYKWQPYIRLNDPDLLQTLWQTFPRIMGLAVSQLNFLIMSAIASLLVTGSIRNLNLAYNLNFLPIGIIAVSYAIAAYPTFCEKVHNKDINGLRASFSLTVRQVIFFMIPATVLFLLLRGPIVRVVYGSQGLDWTSTLVIANTMAIFALSFFAQACVFVLVRALYALEDTMTPFFVGLVAAVVNVGFAIYFVQDYGLMGLAGAFSLSAMLQMALLWVALRLKIGSLDEERISRSLVTLSIAGLAAAFAVQGVKYGLFELWVKYNVVEFIELNTFRSVLFQAALASIVGFAVYAVAAYLLKSPEIKSILAGMQRKFLKNAQPTEVSDIT